MSMTRRALVLGALAGAAPVILPVSSVMAQQPAEATRVSEEQLGEMIAAIGLQPEKKEQRYDFGFRAELEEQEWQFSMSAVLSQDGESLWIMAWLDTLPTSSAEVPRSALLRLLAQNDQLGHGKFFAYIPANRRFVLQRVIPNENVTSAKLRLVLQDLGSSVVETNPVWSVSNWNPTGVPTAPAATESVQPTSQSAANDSKFDEPIRR